MFNALQVLHSMSSDCSEVKEVLVALTCRLIRLKKMLDAVSLNRVFLGLQGMKSVHSEVRDFLSALLSKIKNSHHVFTLLSL